MKIGDWGIKASALGLALFLWFHAVTEHLYEREIDIRLLVEDPAPADSRQQAIVAGEVPEYVRVLAVGRGKELLQLGGDDFVLRLRTEGEVGSARTYRLQLSQIEKRATDLDVAIEDILAPREVKVELDQRVEREVPVRARLDIQIAPAHVQVGPLRVEPAVVKVIGPRRLVEELPSVPTDSLRLLDVREDIDQRLALRLPRRARWSVAPSEVRVLADVQILAEDDIAGVPIEVRHAPDRSLRAEPPTVTVKVRGGVEVIARIDPGKDLGLFVDYAEFVRGNLAVQKPPRREFEILEITPPQVNLVAR